MIEIFADDLRKEDTLGIKPHIGARGIVRRDDEFLLIHLESTDLYTLPGGGVEQGESLEEAVVREVKEETGYVCKVVKPGVVLKEYFSDSIWQNHYFVLELVSEGSVALTEEEKELGLKAVWLSFEDVLHVLSEHESKAVHAEAIMNREFLGFTQSL